MFNKNSFNVFIVSGFVVFTFLLGSASLLLFTPFNTNIIPLSETVSQQNNYLGFDHIYVLSADLNSRRFRSYTAIFKLMKVDFTVFKAFDNNIDRINKFKADNPTYVDTETSTVKMTHYAAYIDAVKSNYTSALFMEDDFDFDFSAATMVPHAVSQLPHDWDYLGLFWNLESRKREDVFIEYSANLARLKRSLWIGGVAYALSASGMRRVLNHGLNNGAPGDVTIAGMIDNLELKAYVVTPLILDHLGSTLEFPSIRMNDTSTMRPYKSRLQNSIFENIRTP
jgi:GR25 family glycosyltransferase involved in LPS biosynthesis